MTDSKNAVLDLSSLQQAVAGPSVAIRAVRRLQPAGGPGDKVFPPTYGVEDGAPHKYATEKRRIGGVEVDTVLLDSVQSQANRIEEALLEAWRRRLIRIPVVAVDFRGEAELSDLGMITSLDAPHRLADAILRDSVLNGKPFRLSDEGLAFAEARPANATAVYRCCPTALVFGIWDSTGPRGGLGAKFQRALVSEIVGVAAVLGAKTSSRIDPLQVQDISKSSPIYVGASEPWTLDAAAARTERKAPVLLGKGKPSEINHGNVLPTIDPRSGGVTIDYALQTVVLSLAALRRLRFPTDIEGKPIADAGRDAAEAAARTALAALGLAGVVLQQEQGYDLRSRCLLVPEGPLTFEIVAGDGSAPRPATLTPEQALTLVEDAEAAAAKLGLGWPGKVGEPLLSLKPAPRLAELVRRSRAVAAASVTTE